MTWEASHFFPLHAPGHGDLCRNAEILAPSVTRSPQDQITCSRMFPSLPLLGTPLIFSLCFASNLYDPGSEITTDEESDGNFMPPSPLLRETSLFNSLCKVLLDWPIKESKRSFLPLMSGVLVE